MGFQNLETFTEVDPNSHITPSGSRNDWAGVTRNEDVYLYDDKGVNHFDGDFEHLFEVYFDSASDAGAYAVPWMLSNDIDDEKGLRDASKSYLTIILYTPSGVPTIYLRESDSGTFYDDFRTSLSADTPYYLKVKRDESIGTYGTIYCYIYTDSSRTVLIDTLSITLHTSKKDYRYFWAFNSINTGVTNAATGYSQNYNLQEVGTGNAFMMLMGVGG